MKVKTGLLFFLFCIGNYLLAQSNQLSTETLVGNGATITTDSVAQLSLNKSVLIGTWAENTSSLSFNLDIYVESDVLPTELGFYKGQSSFQFLSHNRFSIFEVSYDGGNWVRLAQNSFYTGEFSPPWETVGLHTMAIRYWYVDGIIHNWSFNVYVASPRDKIYYDGNGNWVSGWTGTTTAIDRPVIVVEGFDPVNTTFPDYYYGKASNFFDKIRSLDADVMIFNFVDGGKDLAENAQIIKGFVRYIESIVQGNQKIILAGLSMGGVIARYALAEAEQENQPLNISHFLSIDSPQQEALIPQDLQDYINENDNGVPKPALNALAAKQMLFYNTYDPNRNTINSAHKVFFNKLNSLNGNGYPHNCINIGVSFAPNKRNPNLGEWLTVEISGPYPDQHFYLWEDNECKVAGSYLPLSATIANGFSIWPSWQITRHLDPTFIPYTSSLDIVNGISKFDRRINSSQFNFHDSFPDDIVNPIAFEIGLLPDSYTNVVFKNLVNDNIDAGGSLKVTGYSGLQYPISSGDGVQLLTNQQHTVETLDRYRLNFSSTGINYQQNNWNKILSEFKTKKIFKGWENNGLQEAYFTKIDKITIKNNLEDCLSSGDIDFKDPWYKIGDNQPNDFNTINSPFTPGDGNYIFYGGAFLNQNLNFLPNIPNYSVKAPQTQNINLGGALGTCTFYFQNWAYDPNKISLQYPNALETGVVFKETNAQLAANYKGQGLSNDQNAYANNSQRKFVRTLDGHLHCVYESMNRIWYERSTNNGQTWELMNNGKPLSNQDSKLPAIDYRPKFPGSGVAFGDVGIVFQEKNGEAYKIKFYGFGPNFGTGYPDPNPIELYSTSVYPYTFDANPAIAWQHNGDLVVVWNNYYDGVSKKNIFSYWFGSITPHGVLFFERNIIGSTNGIADYPSVVPLTHLYI
ncbi:MAG: DUF2974 domain-containing protein [Ignavibacteria bacterium]|nr:DUF2974 domain-containing protein [Ignavibacteria bacterium]